MKSKLCGAKTRAGTPCKRIARQPQGRCRLHGGCSLMGFAHPNFKHGQRSKYWFSEPPPPISAVVEAAQAQGMSLEEIRFHRARRRQRLAAQSEGQAGVKSRRGGK